MNPYHFLETYCLRAPLLSIDSYKALFKEERIEFGRLKSLWNNEALQEAVFLASPYVYTELCNYFEGIIKDNSKIEQLKHTFLKYFIRASTRCTPFGLFAGVGTGQFGKVTHIELKPIEHYERVTKYDTNYVSALLNHFSADPSIKNQLLFYPNSTLYKVADQYRYVEYRLEKTRRSYSVEAVEYTPYLDKVLSQSENGKTIAQLAGELTGTDVSVEEAHEFIEALVENQLLVSELELNVTGEDTLTLMMKRVGELDNTQKILPVFQSLKNHLTGIDKKVGNTSKPYQNTFKTIKEVGVAFEEKFVFQTDLFSKTHTNELAIKHAYTLKKLLPLFIKLSPQKPNQNLEAFRKAFYERYETREMPLAKVLDIESGIGYLQHYSVSDTTPFLQNILPPGRNSKKDTFSWSPADNVVYQKLLEAEINNDFEIELTDKDFSHIELNWQRAPTTLSAFVEIINMDNEEWLVVKGCSANAGNLLARFSYGDDKLLKHVKHITDLEQKMEPDKILDEIVHLPESRTGNILKRPHLRDYEIPYLAKSTLPVAQQIPVDDLWISVKNDRFVLTSKKLNKEILPRLTNAHNYALNALPIYHFLCDLQFQNNNSYVGFSWPEITGKRSFLPRVMYKKTIVSKARWYLRRKEIHAFMGHYGDEKLLLKNIREWRNRFHVPKYVQLAEGDNTLLIDMEQFDSLQLLLSTIKNKPQCLLEEFLFMENPVVKREGEGFTNEFVFTFYNQLRIGN